MIKKIVAEFVNGIGCGFVLIFILSTSRSPFAGVSHCSPGLTALIFSPYSLPCFRSFGLSKSILDSSVEMDMVNLYENCESFMSLKEKLECLKKKKQTVKRRWEIFSHMLQFRFERKTKWGVTWNNRSNDGAAPDGLSRILQGMAYENYHSALNVVKTCQSRYPRDPKISQLLEKIKRMSGFLLGVVVLFMYQYSIGYVETGRWNTYSNGAWEFRATYVCIELRLGSYPFQKFREAPRRFGVRPKNKNGVTVKYEPWVWFRKRKIYFEVQKTEDKAARIRDVAKYWLKSEGRDPLNFGEEDYYYLNFVQEFHPQQSDNENEENHKIRKLVLEHAQRILKEDQQSQVPIVYQLPCVEPARFASKHITPWLITFQENVLLFQSSFSVK